jgi:hypothetical protein
VINQSLLHNQRTTLIASLCCAISIRNKMIPVCSLFIADSKGFSWTFYSGYDRQGGRLYLFFLYLSVSFCSPLLHSRSRETVLFQGSEWPVNTGYHFITDICSYGGECFMLNELESPHHKQGRRSRPSLVFNFDAFSLPLDLVVLFTVSLSADER